ncbi:MAG TPA: thiamine pyrophosphate-dependent enzyme [Candidatus Eisenbacteria bacterium]|nr:thiamine pyrophosphate-dependent enzyme [Candidatus Eisenbacteria bacterium]
MTLADALAIIMPRLTNEACVCSNGFMSRAAYGARDSDASFYMIGSMGLASSIGLGIATARPSRRVLVLDGDGNVLMNMGTLATIAVAAPTNLLHVCFDNAAHASTGGQRTISDRVRLDAVARAAGYAWVGRVETPAELTGQVPAFLAKEGPAFLLVRIALGPPGPPGPRIPYTPTEMTARMRRALGADS